MTPDETLRLFRELGEIAGSIRAGREALDGHIRLDEERHRNLDGRVERLEGKAEITGQQSLEEVKAKAKELERESKDRSFFTKDTVRQGFMLVLGGLITLIFLFISIRLGLTKP